MQVQKKHLRGFDPLRGGSRGVDRTSRTPWLRACCRKIFSRQTWWWVVRRSYISEPADQFLHVCVSRASTGGSATDVIISVRLIWPTPPDALQRITMTLLANWWGNRWFLWRMRAMCYRVDCKQVTLHSGHYLTDTSLTLIGSWKKTYVKGKGGGMTRRLKVP